jgi:hypothetical protein
LGFSFLFVIFSSEFLLLCFISFSCIQCL